MDKLEEIEKMWPLHVPLNSQEVHKVPSADVAMEQIRYLLALVHMKKADVELIQTEANALREEVRLLKNKLNTPPDCDKCAVPMTYTNPGVKLCVVCFEASKQRVQDWCANIVRAANIYTEEVEGQTVVDGNLTLLKAADAIRTTFFKGSVL